MNRIFLILTLGVLVNSFVFNANAKQPIIILANPDGSAGIYLDGKKIATAQKFQISPDVIHSGILQKDPAKLSIDTNPKPNPCGAIECPPKVEDPKPEPKPIVSPIEPSEPGCTGPSCGVVTSYGDPSNRLILLDKNKNSSLPNDLNHMQ